jgi:hypothetical protein
MKVYDIPLEQIVSLERLVRVESGEDEVGESNELEDGLYAIDSEGRVWKQLSSITGILQAATEHDGVKRRRRKRVSP